MRGSHALRLARGLRGGDQASAADSTDYPAADARAGAVAESDAIAAYGPKRQTTVALSRRPFRRSILFRVLAGAGLWPRRSPAPPRTARSTVADAR